MGNVLRSSAIKLDLLCIQVSKYWDKSLNQRLLFRHCREGTHRHEDLSNQLQAPWFLLF